MLRDPETLPMKLNTEEITRYHEDGLVIPAHYRVPEPLLERIRVAYDNLLAANAGNPEFSADFILGPHLTTPGTYGVKGDPVWLEFAQIPEVLDMLEQVAGPDLVLWGVTIFGKPAHTGKETPWHQDGDYYPIEPLETTTVWISLDGSTPEQGCMRYIPGSHKEHRIFPHHNEQRDDLTLGQVIDDDQYDEDTARDIVLEPGQLSIHDVYLIHGSGANRSDRRRMGLVLRFMPASSFYNHDSGKLKEESGSPHGYSNRALFLVRGADKSGRNDFSRGHEQAVSA